MGVITVSSKEKHNYTSGDLKLLTSLGLEAAVALQNTYLQQNKIKEELIKNNLGRFVSPQVLENILNAKGELSLSSEKRKVALLFSDIRNFTGFCEILSPEEIVSYLNEYFTEMVNVIFSHNGSIDKFVGDAIFALFGAPNQVLDTEKKAVEAAIEMQITLKNIKNLWIQNNFTMGIGLNAGDVVVGNIATAAAAEALIAAGADGHREDPLSRLNYEVEGSQAAMAKVRESFPSLPILMGGAGGYLPDSRTPEVWSSFAQQLSQ